jgi:hypothetical protein
VDASHGPQGAGFNRGRNGSFCEIFVTLLVRNFCDAVQNFRDVTGRRSSMTKTQGCLLSLLDSVAIHPMRPLDTARAMMGIARAQPAKTGLNALLAREDGRERPFLRALHSSYKMQSRARLLGRVLINRPCPLSPQEQRKGGHLKAAAVVPRD